jgi:(Z)-2-((N-methylformamido)methylene)-5-hydroxybutyrolactone dehydrogenase
MSTDPLPHYDLFIAGRAEPAASGKTYETVNPYLGKPWAIVPDGGEVDVDRAVRAAREALGRPWIAMTGFDRARLLRTLATILERDADTLAALETRDTGKLLREMSAQTRYLPQWFNYFAGAADKIEGATIPSDRPNFFVYTRREPVGVVAAIVPWNSPLLLLTWKLAPALAAGCTVVVKPSDYTPVTAIELARRVDEAGFPSGVFNVVTGNGPEVGRALARHPGVDKVAFTGSTRTGIDVAQGAMSHLGRVSLELGGKSAQIVFADADLTAAANGVIAGVFAATGQTCIAGSRLLVHRSVQDDLVRRIVDRAERIVLGDPMDPKTEMGPLANRAQLDKVRGFLDEAAREGARFACGRDGAEPGGYFVRPTVLVGVRRDSRVVREEIFGPVLSVLAFDDEEEAIALANDGVYGLAAGVWTLDVRRAHRVAASVRAGSVWINAYRVVAPNVPFGGFGASGIGRENGFDAIREFTETKAVWVELSGATRDPFTIG